ALVSLEVKAGFGGAFRDNHWIPLRVTIRNNGDAFVGKIVVRPDTTEFVDSTFSRVIELPTNSQKSAHLYITARAPLQNLLVELIDTQTNAAVVNRSVPMRAVSINNPLYVLVSESLVGRLDLSGVHPLGLNATQAQWDIADIPPYPDALGAVNLLMFSDVDTTQLSPSQLQSLQAWVAMGGHLVVTGGANGALTADGLRPLLPVDIGGTTTLDGLIPIAETLGGARSRLNGQTIATLGTPHLGAQVLAQTADGVPLWVRGTYGNGVVDYLAVDPNVAPLRDWDRLDEFWYLLMQTRAPLPNWTYGLVAVNHATQAAEIIPGVNLLPSIWGICSFLLLYVAMMGPINYLVVRRLKRPELAWLTIPLLIGIFSLLAYVFGGRIRGDLARVGRIALVRSWADVEDFAHVTELSGLLSPIRTTYTLRADEDALLRPIKSGDLGASGLLATALQTNVEVEYGDATRAVNFAVDSSVVAPFISTGIAPKPAISGFATLDYDPAEGGFRVRGSVENNTAAPLTDAVILARGVAHRLRTSIEPNEIEPFEFVLNGAGPAAPMRLGSGLSQPLQLFGFDLNVALNPYDPTKQTVLDILGEDPFFVPDAFGESLPKSTTQLQQDRWRILFLTALMSDPSISTARGDTLYLATWSEAESLHSFTLEGRGFRDVDSALHLVQLESEVVDDGQTVQLGSDQFVWSLEGLENTQTVSSPYTLNLKAGQSAAFRFTPLPTAQLADVSVLTIALTSNSTQTIPIEVWSWERGSWRTYTISRDVPIVISRPHEAGMLGAAFHEVRVRVRGENIGLIDSVGILVSQRGTY
ncbi:MAG: hypothetical protein ACOYLB_12860, partial [Phototrophicaceae bacterium]